MIDFNTFESIIQNNDKFLIIPCKPDADAIGSEIAFYLILKARQETHIINHGETPYNLKFWIVMK
jgi:nanoRNase/pAp phosphatase (c-di-AMP/oligoRNAs hydrolase)